MAEDGAGGDPGGSAGTRPCPGRAGRMHHRMHHPPGAGQVRTGRQGGPRGLAWLFPILDCGRWSCDCVPRPLSDKQEEDGGGSRLQVQKEERRLVCREIGPFWCLTNAAWSRASCPSAREASVGGGLLVLLPLFPTQCAPPLLCGLENVLPLCRASCCVHGPAFSAFLVFVGHSLPFILSSFKEQHVNKVFRGHQGQSVCVD